MKKLIVVLFLLTLFSSVTFAQHYYMDWRTWKCYESLKFPAPSSITDFQIWPVCGFEDIREYGWAGSHSLSVLTTATCLNTPAGVSKYLQKGITMGTTCSKPYNLDVKADKWTLYSYITDGIEASGFIQDNRTEVILASGYGYANCDGTSRVPSPRAGVCPP